MSNRSDRAEEAISLRDKLILAHARDKGFVGAVKDTRDPGGDVVAAGW